MFMVTFISNNLSQVIHLAGVGVHDSADQGGRFGIAARDPVQALTRPAFLLRFASTQVAIENRDLCAR
ncbi:hypothetical protein [Microvirga tunisiensis]|jgi:hypothetical protein|nr:hypothetical protein [Microvirga tunisiensis]